MFTGQTAEDAFMGFRDADGIGSIKLSMDFGIGIEIDHIQWQDCSRCVPELVGDFDSDGDVDSADRTCLWGIGLAHCYLPIPDNPTVLVTPTEMAMSTLPTRRC